MSFREETSDLAVLERLVELPGRDIVDVGCGGGALARELRSRGAGVVGVEISEEQLAPAIAHDGGSGAKYLVGRAQVLPLEDASVDVVVFMRSLHHVPAADLTRSLREARRVLRPDGIVYVAEPLAEGDFFALTSLVEDELEARSAVQAALSESSRAGLQRSLTVDYDVRVRIADHDALRHRMVSVDSERAAIFDARERELAEALVELGEAGEQPGERQFVAPMRADVLRPS